jgi:hypothetical protein
MGGMLHTLIHADRTKLYHRALKVSSKINIIFGLNNTNRGQEKKRRRRGLWHATSIDFNNRTDNRGGAHNEFPPRPVEFTDLLNSELGAPFHG